jgi:hypothetical protein
MYTENDGRRSGEGALIEEDDKVGRNALTLRFAINDERVIKQLPDRGRLSVAKDRKCWKWRNPERIKVAFIDADLDKNGEAK